MTLTSIINIAVLLFPFIGAYAVYILQKKAQLIDSLVERLYRIEKEQAVINTKLEERK